MKFLACFLALVSSAFAQVPGTTINLSVRVGLLSRSYQLYVPSAWNPANGEVPLVLNYHGLTNSPSDQARISGANAYAEQYGWAVAYPAGITASHNGGICCTPANTLRIDDVGFARALISDVASRMPINRDAVFSMGFSNGGFMTERLACEASDLFAAMGPHSGRRGFGGDFQSCTPSSPVPVIAITGTLDIAVPYPGNPVLNFPSFSQDRRNMQEAMGCNPSESPASLNVTSTTTCDMYSSCANGAFLEYCTVRGGDHSWFTSPDIDSTAHLFMRFAQAAGLEHEKYPVLNLPKVAPRVPKSLA